MDEHDRPSGPSHEAYHVNQPPHAPDARAARSGAAPDAGPRSPATRRGKSPLVPILAGFLCGVGLFIAFVPADKLGRAIKALSGSDTESMVPTPTPAPTKKGAKAAADGRKALAARALPADAALGAGGSLDAASPLFAGAQELEAFSGEAERALFGSKGADVGGRVSLQGGALVVTRGQFVDVVTRRMPSSLPTVAGRDGVVFIATSEADVRGGALRAALDEHDIPHDSLCGPGRLDARAFRRVSLVFHASTANLACARSLLASIAPAPASPSSARPAQATGSPATSKPAAPGAAPVLEVSLVALGSGEGYFAAREQDGRRYTLQTWSNDWIDQVTPTWNDDAGLDRAEARARRLASIARVLSKPSDIVIEVPLAPFAPGAGVVGRDGSATLPFGNFSAFPRAALSGTFRARRVGAGVGKSKGKEAITTLAPGTEVLIVSGVGNGLKFEAVAK